MSTATNTVADNSAFGGPDATQAANANAALGVSTPSAISPSSLTTTETPLSVPQQPGVDTHAATNASIPSPVGTPESIINNANQPTATQTAQTGILAKIAGLMGQNTSQATLQTNAESAAGIPALTKTANDLSTQILGLNDQASKLQIDASAGGTIENQAALDATGLRSQQGQAPLTAASLRQNQIQQAGIASQALTLKSAYYAAQGNLTLAKDSADKAAQVQFDAAQQQINYQKSLLDALAPQLSREDAQRAQLITAQLNDRQQQITQQMDNKKNGTALAIAAMTNNPNDPQAQAAGQAALKLDPTSPNYLANVSALVGQYQNNNVKAALDQQLEKAQINEANASAAKTSQETKNLNGNGGGVMTTIQDNKGNDISVPVNVAPYVSFSNSGVKYADLSAVQGTAAEKAQAVKSAQAAGIKVITNKDTALDLTNIGDANSKLDTISTIMAGIDQPSALSRDLGGMGLTSLASLAQTSPQKAAAGALQGVGLDILKAISGVQGFRGNTAVVQQITDHLPSINDTNQTVQDKISYIRALIDDRENKILGQTGTNSTGGTITAGGKTFTIGQVYQDASGTKWAADANGKWTKQ